MTLTSTDRAAIVDHMNRDHADAVLHYVQFFGATPLATAATLIAIDSDAMYIDAHLNGQLKKVTIGFDQPIHDSATARKVLIKMARQARDALAQSGCAD
jgi:putative heme iron utilization protein